MYVQVSVSLKIVIVQLELDDEAFHRALRTKTQQRDRSSNSRREAYLHFSNLFSFALFLPDRIGRRLFRRRIVFPRAELCVCVSVSAFVCVQLN